MDGNTIGISAGTKTLYFYKIKKEENVLTNENATTLEQNGTDESLVTKKEKTTQPAPLGSAGDDSPLKGDWETAMQHSINDVIATTDGNWLVGGNSNEIVNEVIKSIESGTSTASGGPKKVSPKFNSSITPVSLPSLSGPCPHRICFVPPWK